MADRPRYVPSRNRRAKNQRFHGAFTGGFSAGFYNTVGSTEGWQPKNDERVDELPASVDEEGNIVAQDYTPPSRKRSRPQQQKLEDFMDEEDHDQWGGPTSLRREYKDPSNASHNPLDNNANSSSNNNSTTENIGDWMKIATVVPPANVGNRLLRVLGWREGNSAAYVPDATINTAKATDTCTANQSTPESSVLLSKKRLRKVQLQQKRVKIPPPKLNTCGLGYEPYQNAPEFRAHQEKRRKQAQQRAQLNSSTNVYRISDVLENEEEDNNTNLKPNRQQQQPNSNNHDQDDPAYSYETMEDFVGHKSVGGFALREDEDDAYDDDQPLSLTKASDKVRIDSEAFNTEVYEHQSSDDDDENNNHQMSSSAPRHANDNNINNRNNLAGILSSFADTGPASSSLQTPKAAAFTTDGRPPLAGFVMGGAFASHSKPKRYRGPDVPSDYQVKHHEFRPNEHPSVLRALSHAVQLQVVDEKRKQAMDEALRINATSNKPARQRFQHMAKNISNSNNSNNTSAERSKTPMAGGAFAGLAEAMKSRFTSVKENSDTATKLQSGLRLPSKESQKTTVNEPAAEEPQRSAPDEIKITRKIYPFAPHRLLCKRFHVPVPEISKQSTDQTGGGRVTEDSYFRQEILNPATKNNPEANNKKKEAPPTKSKASVPKPGGGMFEEDGTMKDDALGAIPADQGKDKEERPSLETYKSIFEPQADDESESDLDESDPEILDEEDPKHDNTADDSKEKDPQKNAAAREEIKETNGEEKKTETEKTAGTDGAHRAIDGDARDDAVVAMDDRDRSRKKKKHKSKRRSRDRKSSHDGSDDDGSRQGQIRKRSRSVSSESTDLSRDSSSRDRKRRRERKDKKKKKHKHKSKKKSKRK
ncbi:patch domain-containing protein TGH homolog [Seminavis robusta]|uniref:Patch domain-containing protein TGH homolog n=1 Tax=Seminavis robusta TaxID=568900 RepID=A0A9N8H848_9STRA|nr:patch domain-containing protein TGH homolog [Seminavis robusta]|eukprot:Sro83_g044210.1 patch domain-containing protein TGH homolog (875) ;mRNA; f:18903-21527